MKAQALSALLVMFVGTNAVAQSWPTLALPEDARAFSVGEQIVANGTPMRVQVFVSNRSPAEVAAWFRHSLGKPIVENKVQDKLVLGRQAGDFYETVQLEASASGTRGVTAVTPLRPAQQQHAEARARLARWLSRMPAGTQVVTDMSSRDGGKVSLYLVVINTQTEALNRERLALLMAEEGYRLEREARPDEVSAASGAGGSGGSTLFFKGPGKEAIATIHRDSNGRTAIVFNTVAQLEPLN